MDWKVAIYDYLQEVRRSSERYRALILLTLGVVAIILGYVGFAAQSKYLGIERSSLDLLYRVADLFAFRGGDDVAPGNWQLEIARWLAPGVTLFALYEFIKALLSEQVKSFRLQLVGNHVIVCGLGFLGPEIVANFRERGMRVVIIEKEADNPNLDACREMGAITVIGNATDPLMLKKVRVHRARYLFAVTGNDSHNSGIAVAAHRLADAGNARGLTCFVHIVDVGLCSLLKERQIAMDDDRFKIGRAHV